MALFLCILSICTLVFGGLYLNQATLGVGIVGGALWLGMIARIVQADDHHKALLKRLPGDK